MIVYLGTRKGRHWTDTPPPSKSAGLVQRRRSAKDVEAIEA